MADEAVNVFSFAEIKVFVFPTIPRMAARAAWPVGINSNTEVVQSIFLAELHLLTVNLLLLGPGPVNRLHEGMRLSVMALQTLLRHLGSIFKWAVTDVLRMITREC